MYDLHQLQQLHKEANDSLARRLHSRMRGLRGGAGDLCPTLEKSAGRTPVSTDAAKTADEERDSGGDQSAGLTASSPQKSTGTV